MTDALAALRTEVPDAGDRPASPSLGDQDRPQAALPLGQPAPGRYLATEERGELVLFALGDRDGQSLRIGRSPASDILLDDPSVSRRHAVVMHRGGRTVLLDDRSLNGIFVNGERVGEAPSPMGTHRHRAREFAVRRGHWRLSSPGRRRYRPAPHIPGLGLPTQPGPGIPFPWPNAKLHGHFSPGEVGELAGVSGNTIGQWARWEYIRASQSDGDPHVYRVEDVAEAAIVSELLERGVRHRDVRRAIHYLDDYGDWPLSEAPLATTPDGRLVLLREDGEIFALSARGWQLMSRAAGDCDVRLRLRALSPAELAPARPTAARPSPRRACRGRPRAVAGAAELASPPARWRAPARRPRRQRPRGLVLDRAQARLPAPVPGRELGVVAVRGERGEDTRAAS